MKIDYYTNPCDFVEKDKCPNYIWTTIYQTIQNQKIKSSPFIFKTVNYEFA